MNHMIRIHAPQGHKRSRLLNKEEARKEHVGGEVLCYVW